MPALRLPRRAVLGSVLAVSLLGGGMFAASQAEEPVCTPTYTDPAGDAGAGDPATAPATGDPNLDIVAVAFSVDAGVFSTRIKVVKLNPTGPEFSFADRFITGFTVAKKAVTVTAERDFSGFGTKKASATVGGTAVTFPVKLIEDLKGNTIGASFAVADFEKVIGVPLAGEAFTAMTSTSRIVYPSNAAPGTAQPAYDTAPAPATAKYLFGQSCFGGSAPAPGATPSSGGGSSATATATIEISAPSRIRTSDLEPVQVTFKDSEGQPMSGKRITAQVGSGPVAAATTNAQGQARLLARVVDRAGTRALVVRHAGASDGSGKAEARKSITVLAEVSKIATRSSGSGSLRTFTVTLTDDDPVRHPYGGAKLTLAYNQRTITVTTDSSGRASIRVRQGTRIDIRYAGRPGFVLSSYARTIVQ